MTRIDELLQQRAAIDAELESLKGEAEKELQAAENRIAQLNAALGKPAIPTFDKLGHLRARTEIDETDAGSGVPEPRVNGQSAEDFRGELHMLRERSREKRRNREH